MNDWKKFNETSLLEKEVFFSDLSMEDITYAYYAHGKRVCKDFAKGNSKYMKDYDKNEESP